MDHRREVKDSLNYLESKEAERKKRRRIGGAIFAIIVIVLLLMQLRCEDSFPPADLPLKKARTGAAAAQVQPRHVPSRLNFENRDGELAPWAAELYAGLEKRRNAVKACFPPASNYSFTWSFSYLIQNGLLLHQGFNWNSNEPNESTKICLRNVLEEKIRILSKIIENQNRFNLNISYSDDVGRNSDDQESEYR